MTNNAVDPVLLQAARRLEIDCAIGLALSLLCCVLGLLLSLRNLRKLSQMKDEVEQHEMAFDIQMRLGAARVLSICGIVFSIAVPLTVLLWWAIVLFAGNS